MERARRRILAQRRMRRAAPRRVGAALGIAAAMALALGAGTPGPAPASSAGVECPFRADIVYDSPLTLLGGGDVDFESAEVAVACSGGASGTLRLVGTAGAAPRPAGGESCLSGAGSGRIELRLRAHAGRPETFVTGDFKYRHVGSTWTAQGRVTSPVRGAGVGITAVEISNSGSCVGSGRTVSTLAGELTISGDVHAVDSGGGPRCTHRIVGTADADRVWGTAESDALSGRGGSDRIVARRGADCIDAGPGADRVLPGAGLDVVRCGAGRDVVLHDPADAVGRDCETIIRR